MYIKEFSAQTGLSADTLRYYEKEGLLLPERDGNGTAFTARATPNGRASSCV